LAIIPTDKADAIIARARNLLASHSTMQHLKFKNTAIKAVRAGDMMAARWRDMPAYVSEPIRHSASV
jgi:hypothetical protein